MINEVEIREKLTQLTHEELLEQAVKDKLQLNNIMEQLAVMQRQKYAKTSENVPTEQLSLFNEIEEIYDKSTKEELEEKPIEIKKKKIRTVKKEELDYFNLPSTTIHHEIDNKKCPECGTMMKETKPTIKYELKYTPAQYKIIKHVVHNYVCPNIEHENMVHVEAKPIEFHRLIEGSYVSASVVAGIAVNKFVQGVPLYRQESELKRQGVPISRQNMSNWMMRCGEDYLETVFNAMWKDLKELKYLHMDETTLTVLEEKKDEGKEKSYVWLAMSGKNEAKQMALYFYGDGRKYGNVTKILGEDENKRYVHSDGYEAYHGQSFKNVACMAHVRRRFFEALEVNPAYKKYEQAKTKEERKAILDENASLCNELMIMSWIQQMFQLDQTVKDRKNMKAEKMKSLYDQFFTCLRELEPKYTNAGKMGRAIKYALDLEEELRNYLEDENLEISNNRAERSIKPFVIARKNFLFSNTKRGAKESLVYFSIIESAKMNGLDPFKYLEYILDCLSKYGLKDELIQSILPYSNELPKELYSKTKDQKNRK